MNIKDNIYNLLKYRNLSIPILAKKIGTSPQNIYNQLNRDFPNLETLCKIADVLQVDICRIISGAATDLGTKIVCPHCGKQISIHIEPSRK